MRIVVISNTHTTSPNAKEYKYKYSMVYTRAKHISLHAPWGSRDTHTLRWDVRSSFVWENPRWALVSADAGGYMYQPRKTSLHSQSRVVYFIFIAKTAIRSTQSGRSRDEGGDGRLRARKNPNGSPRFNLTTYNLISHSHRSRKFTTPKCWITFVTYCVSYAWDSGIRISDTLIINSRMMLTWSKCSV